MLIAVSGVRAQTSLRVLDWNIHRDIGGSDSVTSAQPALAKVVNTLDPDVWTINELGGNNVAYNATTAHNYLVSFIQSDLTIFGTNPQENVNFYIYQSTLNDGYDTVAIVSRYPFLSTQTFSDKGSQFGSERGLAMAVVNVPGNTDVAVFTAHLKALNTTADAEQRQEEAGVDQGNVATWISGHAGVAAMLTGDWNESEDAGDPVNWSGSHHIGDSLPNGAGAYHPITTMRGNLKDPIPLSIAGNDDTIDSTSPTQRFDYIDYNQTNLSLTSSQVFDTNQFTSSQLTAYNTAHGTSFVAGDSASASDHLPVFDVFQVVPEPSSGALVGAALLPLLARSRSRRSAERKTVKRA